MKGNCCQTWFGCGADCGWNSNADDDFIAGFVKGFSDQFVKDIDECLFSKRGNFITSVDTIANGAKKLAASGSNEGWLQLQQGLKSIKNEVTSCAAKDWLARLVDGVDDVLDHVCPHYKVVSGVVQLIFEGEDIAQKIKVLLYVLQQGCHTLVTCTLC
jgi:hypothetical protein